MLSPDTTAGAFGSTTKSVPVVMNDYADADCNRGIVVKGILTPRATRIVANKRKVAVLTVALELFSVLRRFISFPSTNMMDKRITLKKKQANINEWSLFK